MNHWLQKRAKELFLHSLTDWNSGFLEIVCPDKTYCFGDPGASLRAMAVIHDEAFFLRALLGADIGIGESYMDGQWTTPDLVSVVRLAVRNLRLLDSRHRLLSAVRGLASRVRHHLRSNSIAGSKRNIRAHYDLGNEFYKLFLDSNLVYSSACFQCADDSLERAQERKFDLICRKLNLQPGDRVLEIGCGWGGFAIHAARHYGARVTGLTISQSQYDCAVARASSSLGNGAVRFLLEDYRRVTGKFDKIVSIEMFEAVGFENYDAFFAACDRLLEADGSMLLQTITITDQEFAAYRRRVDWMQTYIFPGSELASLAAISQSLMHRTQLVLAHAESMGLHYARTLEIWRRRFLEKLPEVRRMGFDQRFERMWDFYLGWSEGAFRERYINVMQLVLARNGTKGKLLGDPEFAEHPLAPRAVSA